jgi:hypothetical protein
VFAEVGAGLEVGAALELSADEGAGLAGAAPGWHWE